MIRAWVRSWLKDERLPSDLQVICNMLGASSTEDIASTLIRVRQRVACLQLDLQNERVRSTSLAKAREDRSVLIDVLSRKIVKAREVAAPFSGSDSTAGDLARDVLSALDAPPEENS